MGHIYCLMGKSASGKDTIYSKLLANERLKLERIIPYTTRPIRSGEQEGEQYHFTDKAGLDELEAQGKVIECRCYHTYHGDWFYFTVDENVNLENNDYLIIGTPESYGRIREYYGADRVVPFYIELDDGIRLERALGREKSQATPKYEEMCRRFLADAEDFSDDKLKALGIDKRYINENLEQCLCELEEKVWTLRSIR